MPKFIEYKVVKFTGVFELDGTPFASWRDEYIDLDGVLCIYESESFAPGKRFAIFYPNEPSSYSQKYLRTSVGEIIEDGDKVIVESNHRYEFEVGEFISELDKNIILFNVL